MGLESVDDRAVGGRDGVGVVGPRSELDGIARVEERHRAGSGTALIHGDEPVLHRSRGVVDLFLDGGDPSAGLEQGAVGFRQRCLGLVVILQDDGGAAADLLDLVGELGRLGPGRLDLLAQVVGFRLLRARGRASHRQEPDEHDDDRPHTGA